MAVVQAVKSSVSNVKLLAQKTAELPELIEDACRRQGMQGSALDLGKMGKGNGMKKVEKEEAHFFEGVCVCCAVPG